jgi:hypothetical protein
MTLDYIWGALIATVVALLTIICLPHSAIADNQADIDACAEATYETPDQNAAFERCLKARKVATFRPWQRAWQCNDIRVTETVTQRGIVNYDLAGTIWGGSQFALDIQRGTMWFNGRPCVFLGGAP